MNSLLFSLSISINFLSTTFPLWTFKDAVKGQKGGQETRVQAWTWELCNLPQLTVSARIEWRCWTELCLSPHSALSLWMLCMLCHDKELRWIAIIGLCHPCQEEMPWPPHLGCCCHHHCSENVGNFTIGRCLCLTCSSQELAVKGELKVITSPVWIANIG